MATNYPGALDDTTVLPNTRTDDTDQAGSHAQDHNNISDAIRAIEAVLGALPAGVWPTVRDRLDALAPRREYVARHGAVGDGVILSDATMTAGSAILTSPSNPFHPGDQGKMILVSGVGAGNADLVTTIQSYQSAGQVTLAAVAVQASPDVATGRMAVYGTDDTAAIQAASDAAAAVLPQPAELEFDDRVYILAGPLQQGGARAANSQVTLPNVKWPGLNARGQRQMLAWRGARGGAGGAMSAPFPATFGTILMSFAQGASYSATYGIPSVVGGPTQEQQSYFSGLLHEVTDITLLAPRNPTVSGFNWENTAAQNHRRLAVGTLQWGYPTSGQEKGLGEPQHPQACGIIEPRTTNMQNSAGVGEETTIWGFYAAAAPSEHSEWRSTRINGCRIPIAIRNGAGTRIAGISHAMRLGYISMEANPYGISGWDPSAATAALGTVAIPSAHARMDVTLDIEDYADAFFGVTWPVLVNHVNDPNNALYGRIQYTRMAYIGGTFTTTQQLVINGGSQIVATQLDSPVTLGKLSQITQAVIDATTPWTLQLWSGINDFSPTSGPWGVAGLSNVAAIHGGEWFNTTPAIGDEIGWDLMLAKGTWNFAALVAKAANAGILQLYLDGVAIGATFDGYNTSALYNQTFGAFGIAVATTGKHRLSLRVTGKNASSSNYYAIIQGIQARRTA